MKNFRIYYKISGSNEVFTIDNIKDTSAEAVKQTLESTLCAWFKGVNIIKIEEN